MIIYNLQILEVYEIFQMSDVLLYSVNNGNPLSLFNWNLQILEFYEHFQMSIMYKMESPFGVERLFCH